MSKYTIDNKAAFEASSGASSDAHYDVWVAHGRTYSCGLDGKCEKSPTGRSLKDCQRTAKSTENIDLIYLILAYEPSKGLKLPPSGQIRLVKEILGVKVSARKAADVLAALNGDWGLQRQEGLLKQHLERLHTPLQIFTRDLFWGITNWKSHQHNIDYEAAGQQVFKILQDYLERLPVTMTKETLLELHIKRDIALVSLWWLNDDEMIEQEIKHLATFLDALDDDVRLRAIVEGEAARLQQQEEQSVQEF